MKTIILVLFILLSLGIYSQEGYKLYSKVWVGNEKYFNSQKTDSISKKINMKLVNSYLMFLTFLIKLLSILSQYFS